MLTIGICDNNTNDAYQLKNRLGRLCFALPENTDIQIRLFRCIQDILQYLKNADLQLLFLNIEILDPNAEVLFQNHPEIMTIFIFSRQELAYGTVRCHPFRFLCREQLEKELPEILASSLNSYRNLHDICLFHTTEGNRYLPLRRLFYLESQKNYIILHCPKTKHRCRESLSRMESLLSVHGFYRIHSSFLINMEHIKLVASKNTVIMTNEASLPISRNKISGFKDAYIDFLRKKAFP